MFNSKRKEIIFFSKPKEKRYDRNKTRYNNAGLLREGSIARNSKAAPASAGSPPVKNPSSAFNSPRIRPQRESNYAFS